MAKLKDGFYKQTADSIGSNDFVLLAGGGSKLVSDFATASGVVTALGTSGNYVTWTKNGTTNNLTVPYAQSSNRLSFNSTKNLQGLTCHYAGLTGSDDKTGAYVGPISGTTTYSSILRLQSHVTNGGLYYRDLIFDVNSDRIWSRRVTNSGSPVLREIPMTRKVEFTPTPTNEGWYRFASFSTNSGTVSNCIFSIQRSYYSPENEHYIFSVSIGHSGHISITQLSGYTGGHLISKIRVVYTNSSTCYLDFYMTSNNNQDYKNKYAVEIYSGDGTIQTPTLTTTVGGTAYEFTTVNGCKSDKGFTGSLSGNATSATNADTVDGQHFNWNNNKNDHTYLWAASANGQAYLVHRASMSVNYATSTGSATSATSLSSWTAAGSDATKRYIWMSHNDNSGKSCYDADLTYQTNTDTLFVKNVNFSGDQTLYGLTSTCNKANDPNYMNSALQIREYNFGGAQADSWGIAPRLSWHWSGRVQTQIGLNSSGDLKLSKDNFATSYLLLHVGNSSVSGGGSSAGSSITVNIGGTSKTLTIPSSLPANGGTATNAKYLLTQYKDNTTFYSDTYEAYLKWESTDTAAFKFNDGTYKFRADLATVSNGAYYVYDYNATTTPIYIGYSGAALTTATHLAAYSTTSAGSRCIKDITIDTVKTLIGSLKNPNSISFKNTSNTTVSYDGSSALDLTGGIYYASTAGNADTIDGYHATDLVREFWTSSPGYDGNTHNSSSIVTFSYNNNTPYTGVFIDLNSNGYGVMFNTNYYNDGPLAFKRHGTSSDGGMGSWRTLIDSVTIANQSVNYATSAGSVAWSNITGKPTTFTPSSHTHNYLTAYGEAGTASVRTADYTTALCTGGWSGTDKGYGSQYGTTLDVSGYSTWYHRLAFRTDGKIEYWQGINTKTLTRQGILAFTSNIPTKVSQLTNDSGYLTSRGYLGTTAIQSSSATQNVTGIGSLSMSDLLSITKSSNTLTIGSRNGSWCHFDNSTDVPFYFNKAIHSVGGFTIYNTNYTFNSSGNINCNTWTATNKCNITNSTGGKDLGVEVTGKTYGIAFMIGSGDVNRGIYDRTNNKWMFYADASNYYMNNTLVTLAIRPSSNNTYNLGTSSYKWANVYATTFNGNLTGNVTGNVSGSSGSCTGNAATATTATTATSLYTGGASGTSHANALSAYFSSNKSSCPRNKLVSFHSSAYSNGSQYMGYFLSGYNDNPYGGFFVAHYANCYYVGISNGSFSEQQIITSSNIGSQSVNYATSAGNSDTVDSLHVHSGRNNEVNKIVRTDANGYIQAGWINTTSGEFTGTPTRIYASDDGYIRYMSPVNFYTKTILSGSGDSSRAILFRGGDGKPYYTTNIQIDADSKVIKPSANNTGSLGLDGTRWKTVYAYTMYAATAFYQSSDRTLKTNIQNISKDLLDRVYNINEVSFNWKDSGKEAFGYIAQDYEAISKTFVDKQDDGTLTLDYTKALVAQIAALKQKIVNLEECLHILERS